MCWLSSSGVYQVLSTVHIRYHKVCIVIMIVLLLWRMASTSTQQTFSKTILNRNKHRQELPTSPIRESQVQLRRLPHRLSSTSGLFCSYLKSTWGGFSYAPSTPDRRPSSKERNGTERNWRFGAPLRPHRQGHRT